MATMHMLSTDEKWALAIQAAHRAAQAAEHTAFLLKAAGAPPPLVKRAGRIAAAARRLNLRAADASGFTRGETPRGIGPDGFML